jgi:hypothetical protein
MNKKTDTAAKANVAAHRFAIALSFPGEARTRIGAIAMLPAARVGRDHVLYDRFHEAEFARPNLDIYLQELYHDHSDLNVVFLCQIYNRKEWCGLEWRAIRDLIKHRREDIMLLRLDDGPVSGVYSIDGYIDINNRSDDEVAALILQRHTQHHGNGARHPEPSTGQASAENANRPRLLLKNDGKLPNRRTARYQLGLEEGERVHVALQTEHDIDFAICTPASYQRWRATAKLTGSLHLARRTSNMAITLVAKESGVFVESCG